MSKLFEIVKFWKIAFKGRVIFKNPQISKK